MIEPQEVGRYGLIIRALKMPDGKVVMNTRTQNNNFTEELVISVLENHLRYLKEKNYKNYVDNLTEFKGKGDII